MQALNPGRGIFSLMILICCILIGVLLKIASSVFLPLTIAVLLAFVMYPIVSWMRKHRIPKGISIFLVVIILVAVLCIFALVLFSSGSNILAVYPKYEGRITEIYIWVAQFFELPFDESMSVWENIWGQLGIRTWVRNFAFSFTNIFYGFVSNAVLVILFIVFILLEASYFQEKLKAAFDKRSHKINQIGHDLMTQVMRYLTAKFFISLATGIVVGFGMWMIGVEFPILWGVVQFVLNFIPNLGSIAAGVGVSLFALIQFWPEPVPVILVIAIMFGANMIIGNFLDPKIIGEHVGISPVMVLISLGIWGYIWGFAGMILAVPMTVIIKIVCENIPILVPISVLIGTRKSVNIKKAPPDHMEQPE